MSQVNPLASGAARYVARRNLPRAAPDDGQLRAEARFSRASAPRVRSADHAVESIVVRSESTDRSTRSMPLCGSDPKAKDPAARIRVLAKDRGPYRQPRPCVGGAGQAAGRFIGTGRDTHVVLGLQRPVPAVAGWRVVATSASR